MTRDEAKDEMIRIEDLHYESCSTDSMKLIDQIYDSFELGSCESCKYYIDIDIFGYKQMYCHKLSDPWSQGSDRYFNQGKDFGCNKWEKKDEQDV